MSWSPCWTLIFAESLILWLKTRVTKTSLSRIFSDHWSHHSKIQVTEVTEFAAIDFCWDDWSDNRESIRDHGGLILVLDVFFFTSKSEESRLRPNEAMWNAETYRHFYNVHVPPHFYLFFFNSYMFAFLLRTNSLFEVLHFYLHFLYISTFYMFRILTSYMFAFWLCTCCSEHQKEIEWRKRPGKAKEMCIW